MVHIPVQDKDSLNARLLASSHRSHSHVVVEAEPHGARALCVVPRRPHHRKRPVHIPAAHCLHCLHGVQAHPRRQIKIRAHSTLCHSGRITANALSASPRHTACTACMADEPILKAR